MYIRFPYPPFAFFLSSFFGGVRCPFFFFFWFSQWRLFLFPLFFFGGDAEGRRSVEA